MSPTLLSKYLGQEYPPTDQQSDVIGAAPGPLLVVAGAGAGKTETMAARVVWLVANGYARPEEVLGLTFTRKAAQELGKRIRNRLGVLADNDSLLRRLDPTGELAESLRVVAPTISTYDAYAGGLVREYGLLVPVEPDARLITDAELHAITREVVLDYRGQLVTASGKNPAVSTVISDVLGLMSSMGNSLVEPAFIEEQSHIFLAETESLPGKGDPAKFTNEMAKWRDAQELRRNYLPILEELGKQLRARGVVTFNEQMSVAAQLARDHSMVGASQRQRFRVVMLDEYQDTSHAQRILLRSLFGENRDAAGGAAHPLTVTAVGDPMQAIYGWRGATAENLAAFVEDFPCPDGSTAPKRQLTISWRNPPNVLDMANLVSDALLGTGPARAVAALSSRPHAPIGDVQIAFFEHEQEEIDFVADDLARQYENSRETGEIFNAAVLVRANRTSPEVAEALELRGVPYEIVGLAGLLDVPEVADVVAVASMLVNPGDSASALRILSGPAVGLGLKDLSALAQRAGNLRGSARSEDTEDTGHADFTDPMERLHNQLAEVVEEAQRITAGADAPAGLTDAVADLGEPERYSEEGLARMQAVASKLRWLRTHSLGKRLADVFADIIDVFGIRTEVLARPSSTGTVHLDRLLEEVSTYPGASLNALLEYFELARDHEGGLTPGAVPVRDDRVQILTAHKAKGLEWDTVAVIRADRQTYASRNSTFLTQAKLVPDEEFDAFADAEDRTQFAKAANGYIKTSGAKLDEESARLFYVALTRSERKLIVTGSAKKPGRKKVEEPYAHLLALRDLVPEDCVAQWFEGDGEGETDADAGAAVPAKEGIWPHLAADPRDAEAAQAVGAAMADLPGLSQGELFELWERDTTALIEEHDAAASAAVPVVLPGELTASDIVALSADPEQFAHRARRPVPFKPNAYAKRGTAFHEWLEEFYGARPLLSEDELPGADEAGVDTQTLAQLKANFEASHWASRTPAYVEHPFELALGQSVVRGRMDAVFEDEDGWTVVDWKTGTKPPPAQMESAKLQLAVYAEAWRRSVGDGKDVRAVFFYVRSGEDYAPANLPDGAELEALLQQSAAEGIEFER